MSRLAMCQAYTLPLTLLAHVTISCLVVPIIKLASGVERTEFGWFYIARNVLYSFVYF